MAVMSPGPVMSRRHMTSDIISWFSLEEGVLAAVALHSCSFSCGGCGGAFEGEGTGRMKPPVPVSRVEPEGQSHAVLGVLSGAGVPPP